MTWKDWPRLMADKTKGHTMSEAKAPTDAAMRAAKEIGSHDFIGKYPLAGRTEFLNERNLAATIDRETRLPEKEAALRAAADLTDKWKRTEHGADFHHVDNLIRAALAQGA